MNIMKIAILAIGLMASGCLVAMDLQKQINECDQRLSMLLASGDIPKSMRDEYTDCNSMQDGTAEKLKAFMALSSKIKVYQNKTAEKIKFSLQRYFDSAELIVNQSDSFKESLENLKSRIKDDKCNNQEIIDEIQDLIINNTIEIDSEGDHGLKTVVSAYGKLTSRFSRVNIKLFGLVAVISVGYGIYHYFKTTRKNAEISRDPGLDEDVSETIIG